MKALATSIVLVAVMVVGTTIAQAAIISINFDDPTRENPPHDVRPGRTAGVIDVSNWNNVTPGGSGSQPNLMDSNGLPTTADVTWGGSNPATWTTGVVINDADADDNDRMMKGYLDYGGNGQGSTITIDIQEIPYDVYDLYLYHESQGGDGRVMGVSLDGGATWVYTKDETGPFGGTFTEDHHPDVAGAEAGAGGNCILWTGLTADTLSIVTQGQGGGTVRSPVQGMQITPEPATLALLAAGAAATLIRRKK